MGILSFSIHTVGTGKTTTVYNLAASLKRSGLSILLVDMDSQSALTRAVGLDPGATVGLHEILQKKVAGEPVDVGDYILNVNNFSILPASYDLALIEIDLDRTVNWHEYLKEVLAPVVDSYDYVLIDSPPSMNSLSLMALTASEYVIIPLQAEFLPLKGVQSFIKALNKIKDRMNPDLKVLGVLPTQVRHTGVFTEFHDRLSEHVLRSRIRYDEDVINSFRMHMDIYRFNSSGTAAEDYDRLAREIIDLTAD